MATGRAAAAAAQARAQHLQTRLDAIDEKMAMLLQSAASAIDDAQALLGDAAAVTDRTDAATAVPSAAADAEPPAAAAEPLDAPAPRQAPPPAAAPAPRSDGEGAVTFPPGAQRMLLSLGRMAPLRLTKAQWGTVAQMKHTSGTFSTYRGKIRSAGFIDVDGSGFTLSETGFAYLGGRPEPMTAEQLQQHYLSILPKGAARMLRAIMEAYPGGLTREQLGVAAEIVSSSGTFSTYLGALRRNGLAESCDGQIIAITILMRGADQ